MPEKLETAAIGATPKPPQERKKRSLLGKFRLAVLVLILLVLVAVQAPVFPHVAGALLRFAAWCDGASLRIGKIEGGIFEPVIVRDARWTYRAESGAVTRIEVGRARAWLAWSNIFPEPVSGWIRTAARKAHIRPIGSNGLWFHELELDGVTAKLSLPTSEVESAAETAGARWFRSAFGHSKVRPGLVTLRNADLILERGADYLRALNAHFSLGEIAPGTFGTAQLVWNGGGGKKTFRDVRGRTSLQGSRATFAGLRLAPDVTVETFTVSASDIATGKLTLSTRLAAFGGIIEAEAGTGIQGKQLRVDVTGNFSKINVAGLAGFLSLSEAAGGVLKEGTFRFRGTPRDFTSAEAMVRLEAGAFQWDSRQWDSLVLGLSLLDQRLQIPEFKLRQGTNQLTVKGSMALPQPGVNWWERQFDFKVDADIRNLTELSALVLPDFQYAAGQLFVRGSVSGTGAENGQAPLFDGQLILRGTGIQWRTAPLDDLQAALLFRERELQIITAQLSHEDDFLRGSGHLSLTDGSYAGELRLSAKDIAIYKAVMTPYFMPAPLGGGMEVMWSGLGKAGAHDGKFTARLNRFHLLGPGGTLPLDAECNGAYRPGEIQVEKLRLAENGTSLTAAIGIAPGAVNVRDLRVHHQNRLCLQGDALLPLDLWQRWPDVTFANLLNDKTDSRVHLEATELDLHQTSRLTGIDWPVAGILTGKAQGTGALGALKFEGSARLAHGAIPLDWRGGIVREVDAFFTLDGSAIRLDKAAGRHAFGDFTLAGRLDLAKPHEPILDVEGTGTQEAQPFQFTVKGSAAKPAISTTGSAPFSGTAAPLPVPPPASAAN